MRLWPAQQGLKRGQAEGLKVRSDVLTRSYILMIWGRDSSWAICCTIKILPQDTHTKAEWETARFMECVAFVTRSIESRIFSTVFIIFLRGRDDDVMTRSSGCFQWRLDSFSALVRLIMKDGLLEDFFLMVFPNMSSTCGWINIALLLSEPATFTSRLNSKWDDRVLSFGALVDSSSDLISIHFFANDFFGHNGSAV